MATTPETPKPALEPGKALHSSPTWAVIRNPSKGATRASLKAIANPGTNSPTTWVPSSNPSKAVAIKASLKAIASSLGTAVASSSTTVAAAAATREIATTTVVKAADRMETTIIPANTAVTQEEEAVAVAAVAVVSSGTLRSNQRTP